MSLLRPHSPRGNGINCGPRGYSDNPSLRACGRRHNHKPKRDYCPGCPSLTDEEAELAATRHLTEEQERRLADRIAGICLAIRARRASD